MDLTVKQKMEVISLGNNTDIKIIVPFYLNVGCEQEEGSVKAILSNANYQNKKNDYQHCLNSYTPSNRTRKPELQVSMYFISTPK